MAGRVMGAARSSQNAGWQFIEIWPGRLCLLSFLCGICPYQSRHCPGINRSTVRLHFDSVCTGSLLRQKICLPKSSQLWLGNQEDIMSQDSNFQPENNSPISSEAEQKTNLWLTKKDYASP